MGILFCIENSHISFSTTYKRWNNIRKLLLDNCIEYINICQNDIYFENINLSNLLNELIKLKDKTICENNEVLLKNYSTLQTLKIEGIYHLLKLSDHTGIYSHFDSILISQMIELIQSFNFNFIVSDETLTRDIEIIKNIFTTSYENKKDVLIS